jgi:hypothetical protein
MSKFVLPSVLAVTVLASSAAFATPTPRTTGPTPQQAQALKPEIRQQVARELGVSPAHVRVTTGPATYTATTKLNGQKETVTGNIVESPNGGFSTTPGTLTRTPTIVTLIKSKIPLFFRVPSTAHIEYPWGLSREGRDQIAKFVGSSRGTVNVVLFGKAVLLQSALTGSRVFASGTVDAHGSVSNLGAPYDLTELYLFQQRVAPAK